MTPAEYEEILGRLADIMRGLVTERSDLLDRFDRIGAPFEPGGPIGDYWRYRGGRWR